MFSVSIFDQPIDGVLISFLKHLRVEASRISIDVSFRNFRVEYLKPFLHVPHLILGFEDHGWKFLVSYLSALILTQSYPKDFHGLTYSQSYTS